MLQNCVVIGAGVVGVAIARQIRTAGIINLFEIGSPALTASLAIAETVGQIIATD